MSSKKEQQRLVREAKQAQAQRRSKLTGMLVKAGLLVLIPLVIVVLYQGLKTSALVASPIEITAADHVRGADDAQVILTIYGDYQCPSCKEEANIIARAWSRIEDKTRLVVRHFPLDIHRHAFLAARYSEAAARQDRFWEMHDLFYANQELWSNAAEADDLFNSYAESLGLNMEQLQADLESNDIRDKILIDQRSGLRAGVRSTPSMFVNGKLIGSNPRTVSDLVSIVEKAVIDQQE